MHTNNSLMLNPTAGNMYLQKVKNYQEGKEKKKKKKNTEKIPTAPVRDNHSFFLPTDRPRTPFPLNLIPNSKNILTPAMPTKTESHP